MKDSGPNRVLLRWVEDPKLPSREEQVEMLEAHLSEAIVSIGSALGESTCVQLIAQGYQEAGVVSSCRPEGKRFILTIQITAPPELEQREFQRDPGVLAVDHFLTEEEADRILDELDRELGANEFSTLRVGQLSSAIRLLRFGYVLKHLCSCSRGMARFAL